MLQIYFLTIMTNILAGLTISAPFLSKKIKGFDVYAGKMENRLFRVILGSITLITGIFTLLNRGIVDKVAFFGNLVPAISGMALGLILVIYYFFADDNESKLVSTIKNLSDKYGIILGIAGIIIGLIHFLVPSALFL